MAIPEAFNNMAWSYGPASTTAVIAGWYYAMRAKKAGDEQLDLWRSQFHPAPGAARAESNSGHLVLSNAPEGHHAYVQDLKGFHLVEGSQTNYLKRSWGLVERPLPAVLPAGGSLLCTPLAPVLLEQPVHHLEVVMSWSIKPRRGCTITLSVPVPTLVN